MSSVSSVSRDGSARTSTSDIPDNSSTNTDDERKPAAPTRDEGPSPSDTDDTFQLLGQDDEGEVELIAEHYGLNYCQIQECRHIAANLRMNNKRVNAEAIVQYLFSDTCDPAIAEYKVLKRGEFLSKYIPSYFIAKGMEISWSDNKTSLFGASHDKIKFHSCRFEKGKDQGECEVSWDEGRSIRPAEWVTFSHQKRRRRAPAEILSPPPTPKKAKVARRGSNPRGRNHRRDNPQRGHYVSQILGMTKEEVIKSLPDAIREMFGDCVWVKWKSVPRACLVLSPYELERGDVLELWCEQYTKTNAFDRSVQHLIYWYGHGTHSCQNNQSGKVCSLMQARQVYPYKHGIQQGWDKVHQAKIESGTELTNTEQDVLIGIKQMKEDHIKSKPERGGPAFHENQKKLLLAESDAIKKDLNDRYMNFQQHSRDFQKCLTSGEELCRSIGGTEVANKYSSLELCSGSQQMSSSLKSLGFETTSLDCDEKFKACSHMTLEGLRKSVSGIG